MEILHKAKRKDTGEWVAGYYVEDDSRHGENKGFILQMATDFSYSYGDGGNRIRIGCFLEVDPKTVCIYTGKNDEQGKKVWDHDIISINTYDYMEPAENFFGEVVYCEEWACWCIKQPGAEKPIPLCKCQGSYKTNIQILGNAFDNPKMLEAELWQKDLLFDMEIIITAK